MADPGFEYESLRVHILAGHTDLITAANTVVKSRYNLRLQEVTPIPDVSLKLVVQKDYTTPPFNTTANVEIGVPIPVWDRNQGAIKQGREPIWAERSTTSTARDWTYSTNWPTLSSAIRPIAPRSMSI